MLLFNAHPSKQSYKHYITKYAKFQLKVMVFFDKVYKKLVKASYISANTS